MKRFITALLIATGLFAISCGLALLPVILGATGGVLLILIIFVAMVFSAYIGVDKGE